MEQNSQVFKEGYFSTSLGTKCIQGDSSVIPRVNEIQEGFKGFQGYSKGPVAAHPNTGWKRMGMFLRPYINKKDVIDVYFFVTWLSNIWFGKFQNIYY